MIKRLNRKSVFIAFLLSYILILLVPIFMSIGLFGKVETIMLENVDRYNIAMLEQMRGIMDSRLNEVDGLAYQIVKNPRLNELLKHSYSIDDPEIYKFIEFMKELERNKNTSSFIFDLYIYFPASDIILTPSTKTDTEMFYDFIYSYNDMDYEQWKNKILKGYNFKSYLPVMQIKDKQNQRRVITYIQSLPFLEKEDKGELVILIDEKQIKDMLENIEGASQGTIFITDEHNQIIMTTGDSSIPLKDISEKLVNEKDLLNYSLYGQDMMISYIKSKQTGWKFISVVSKSMYISKVNSIKKWALWLLGICLLFGVIVAYILANRNYSPVRNMINDIIKEKGTLPQKKSNEYGFIKETIFNGMNEEKKLRNVISEQGPVVRANFLARLIRGWVQNDGFKKDTLEFIGIRFLSNYFLVMIINVDDASRFIKEESESELALVRFLLTNICSELVNEKNQGYTVELDRDQLAVLVCFSPERLNNTTEDIRNITNKLSNIINEKFDISITIAAGSAHEGAEGIGESYREALKALDYKIIKGTSAVLHFDETNYLENYYYYPIEVEIQICNFARAGDYKNIENILESIYETNFKLHSITPYLSKCLFTDIISTIMKILNTINIKNKNILKDGFNAIENFSNCKTAQEMYREVKQIFKDICEGVKSGRSGHSDQLLKNITEYIDENFSEGTLSLISIANKFNITPQYLSTFFKKHSEKNLIDYIVEARIKNAKKLMEDDSLTIARIARKVGYADVVGFNRAFKKNEGITPGKYRENLK